MLERHLPPRVLATQDTSAKQFFSLQTLTSPEFILKNFWIVSHGSLLILLLVFFIYGKIRFDRMLKVIQHEKVKNENLQKRLNIALATIRSWEANPDLIHSRDCNLDYIRMRMQEKEFNIALVNQVKVKIKQFISTSLRLNLAQNSSAGIASKSGFKIDETFDVTYETEIQGKKSRRVLFRIQIKLMKLPTQSTSSTVRQIIDCIEAFLSPTGKDPNWQPTIQGRIVSMNWNQKAKPTPLLLLEQHTGGVSLNFRNKIAKSYRTLTGRN